MSLSQKFRKLAILAGRGWAVRATTDAIRKSGLFDAEFYLRQNSDVSQYAGGPLLHYVLYGAGEGRSPHPLFDEHAYRTAHPELKQTGGIGLIHYLQHDGHNPNAWFDGEWYKEQYPESASTGVPPLAHYLLRGAGEGKDPSTRFSTSYYVESNPDVAESGVNPLAHFIEHGRVQGRLPTSHGLRFVIGRSVLKTQIRCVKSAGKSSEAALFVAHSPSGALKPHVGHYLRSLKASGISVTLIVAADNQFEPSKALLAIVSGLYIRQNEGLDFAAWAHVLQLESMYLDAEVLYLLNDSLIGPFNQADFDAVVHRIHTGQADVFGMTENYERSGRYLQSYFLALKASVLRSEVFQGFICQIQVLDDKDDSIEQYERQLSLKLRHGGFKCETLFVSPGISDSTIFRWRNLVDLGLPFVRVLTLRDQLEGVDIAGWKDLVASRGYDVSIAEQAVDEARRLCDSSENKSIYFSAEDYRSWVRRYDTLDDGKREAVHRKIATLASPTLFSIIWIAESPATAEESSELLKSTLTQIYPHWEFLVPEDHPISVSNSDQRVRIVAAKEGSENFADKFNAALTAARGQFVLPVRSSVRLAEHALYELATWIVQTPDSALIYCDEDCISDTGERTDPWFKTAWDPCLALGRDAIGSLTAWRIDLLKHVGGIHKRDESAALVLLYEMSLRAAFAASSSQIHHISKILSHQTLRIESEQVRYAEPMRQVVREHLKAQQAKASVIPSPMAPNWSWVLYDLPEPAPLVSIIVPTRDRADLLERCVASLLSNTDYPSFEVLVVDNDSQEAETLALFNHIQSDRRVRVLPYPGQFNYAAMNNMAVREAQGQVLVLLNNDTESIRPCWLRALVGFAVQAEVGAVGARLLYPDGRVQHAGVVNQSAGPVHEFRFASRADPGPHGELCLARTVSLVTGACLAIRRPLYLEVGGLDETLRVAYNDVDLCMKLVALGYRNVWTPAAELFHFESASRGYDVTPEQRELATREFEQFRRRWGTALGEDPYRNSNLMFGWDELKLAPPVISDRLSSCLS